VASAQGFVLLQSFDNLAKNGLFYGLFQRTGSTPGSALDDEEPWQPAGPIN
jgi:hypothetical protein